MPQRSWRLRPELCSYVATVFVKCRDKTLVRSMGMPQGMTGVLLDFHHLDTVLATEEGGFGRRIHKIYPDSMV